MFLFKDAKPSASKIYAIVFGISWTHKIAGFEDACSSDLFTFAKNGLIREHSRHVVQKCAFSVEDMKCIVHHFGSSEALADIRFVIMCLISYSGFFFSDLMNWFL